jgi:hypothetical protein
MDYLRRCSVMLQRGLSVVDVAYFIGEDAPKMTGLPRPELPKGYDFDYINAEVIEQRLQVKEGRFVLPEGVSYSLLVLPPSETMRPELLAKIKELVEAGGVVFGPAPERSPSMENYPACDDVIKGLVADLWDGGRVLTGDSLDGAFAKLELAPDVVCPQDILWKHRRDGDTDIYFLSNQEDGARTETISFRVAGKTPELWWPETGRIDPEPPFTAAEGRVSMPVDLDIHTSVFVVFRKAADIQERKAPERKPPAVLAQIDGPWTVTFPFGEEMFQQLACWTKHANDDVKYFSGEAVYRAAFTTPEAREGVVLYLGEVNDIAVVRVNGREMGTLWMHSYKVDISAALKDGENHLEITVVNPWKNRLAGDARPDVKNAGTFTSQSVIKADADLKPAGLLGPVKIMVE